MQQQTRIELPPNGNGRYMNYTIWQPETKSVPWCVHMQGWIDSGIDIWLYHDELNRGYHFYRKCKFKSSRAFAEFIRRQITLYKNAFGKNMTIRGIDYRALINGYTEGLKRSGNVHIGTL